MSPIISAIASCILCVCTVITIRNLLLTKERMDLREKMIKQREDRLHQREIELITLESEQKRARIYRLPKSPMRIVKNDDALFMIRDDDEEITKLVEEPMAEFNIHGIMISKLKKPL